MASSATPEPVVLIPAEQQTLWGWPAVANFTLGGLGAGLYLVAGLAAGLERSPAVAVAAWLAPALVLAGFAAVATEAGRPLRAMRVLTRVRTSWMSRELWLGGAFVLLAAADIAFPLRLHRIEGLVAAALLVVAQGFILRRARGVAAWDVPAMPLLFLLSGGVSGAGLYLVIEVGSGRRPAQAVLGGILALLLVSLPAWEAFVAARGSGARARSTAALREGRPGRIIRAAGYTAPALLVTAALIVPGAGPAAAVAGLCMVAGQAYAKAELILGAGQLRPITLANLRLQRRPS